MLRPSWQCVAFAALWFVVAARPAQAQSSAPRITLTTKVYRVDDMVLPSPNYPFQGAWLPGMTKGRAERAGDSRKGARSRVSSGGAPGMMPGSGGAADMMMAGSDGMMAGMPGGGMGGAGMGGAGMGGAMMGGIGGEEVDEQQSFSLTMNDLIDAIVTFIEPASWKENNQSADAGIGRLGSALVVRQTEEVQQQIGAFLEALRQENSATQTLSVEAQWLLLDSEQLAELKTGKRTLDRQALSRLDESVRRYRGQMACFNGQTVHIVSGRLQTVLQGGVPVVGASSVAYQPTIFTAHVGALLEITPTILPGGKAAIVNVVSSVTRWDAPGPAVELGNGESGGASSDDAGSVAGAIRSKPAPRPAARAAGGMPAMAALPGMTADHAAPAMHIDRINVAAQQLATSLRVPLNQLVLVGGMTFSSSDQTDAHDHRQLYLVVEISDCDDAEEVGK